MIQLEVKEEEVVQFDELNDVLKNEILEKKILKLEEAANEAIFICLDDQWSICLEYYIN